MRARSFFTAVLAACPVVMFVATAAVAQTPPSALDDGARSAIVEAAAQALRDRYVHPDVGAEAAAAIEDALAAGSYDELTDPGAFADRLTADLDEVAHDKHMRVASPDPAANLPPPGFTPPPPSESGVARADRLPGDVGYIQIVAFAPVAMFSQPVDRVMADLADMRALILDLRVNIGGDPASVEHLLSYFVDSAPIQISSTVIRTPGTDTFTTQEDWIETTPAVSFAGKPVFVLTNQWTLSAGEAFAFHMQNMDLGTLVGETTAGAANITNTVPLPEGFQIAVPYARGEGSTWEGAGVSPDVAAPAADALRAALQQLGLEPEATDIDALSQARVFTVRTTPAPGGEAAMRRMIAGVQSGAPDYALLNEPMAGALRGRLAELQAMLAGLGAIQSATFLGIDPIYGDVFDVQFAGGRVRWAIALDPAGQVVMWQILPAPLEAVAGPQ